MHIRRANTRDLDQIRRLFSDTVRFVNFRDYDLEQIRIWAAGSENIDRWKSRIAEQYFLIAEKEQMMVGFASMTDEGYVDLMYVHHEHQGKGIGTVLLGNLEEFAERIDKKALSADVSITARPFFEKRGFGVIKIQSREIKDITFSIYMMTKALKTKAEV